MKMHEIRSLGQRYGLKFRVGTTKLEAIRSIQRAEGNFDCYGKATEAYCDQTACIFSADCLQVSRKNAAS